MELFAVGGRLGFTFTQKAVTLAGSEVLQDAAGMQRGEVRAWTCCSTVHRNGIGRESAALALLLLILQSRLYGGEVMLSSLWPDCFILTIPYRHFISLQAQNQSVHQSVCLQFPTMCIYTLHPMRLM